MKRHRKELEKGGGFDAAHRALGVSNTTEMRMSEKSEGTAEQCPNLSNRIAR